MHVPAHPPWEARTIEDLSDLLIEAGTPLNEAFARIHDAPHRLLAVVDGGRLLGTVTDANVRRAALTDPTLSSPVTAALPRSAPSVPPSADDAAVRDLLRSHRLPAVAVIDGDRLVGVRTLGEFPDDLPPAPVAVVMVGGRGERLRPLTDKVPKPLLRVGGHTIIERIILALAASGVSQVFLAVNYLAELFQERLGDGAALGVRIEYVHDPEDEAVGSAGALGLLPQPPDVPLIVTNGDLVTTVDFGAMTDYHRHHGASVTVAGTEHRTYIPYGVLRTTEHHLLSIDEKPERVDFVNAGMYVIDPAVLRYIPEATYMGMDVLIADVIADGLPVHVFPVLEQWFDIGSPEELDRVLMAFAVGEEA